MQIKLPEDGDHRRVSRQIKEFEGRAAGEAQRYLVLHDKYSLSDRSAALQKELGMQHGDFKIGTEFMFGAKQWRCTDVGTRVIVALSTSDHGGGDPNWLKGPPYGVTEQVFDEDDFVGCEEIKNQTPLEAENEAKSQVVM